MARKATASAAGAIPQGWEVETAPEVSSPPPASEPQAAAPAPAPALPEGFEVVEAPGAVKDQYGNFDVAEPDALTVDVVGGIPVSDERHPNHVNALAAGWQGLKDTTLMGYADELQGVGGGIGSLLAGRGFSQGYDAELEAARQQSDDAWESNGTAYGVGAGLGFIPGLALPAGWLGRSGNALARGAGAAAVGGGYGAVSGFGNGEDDRLGGALVGGLIGAGGGVVLPPLLGAAGDTLRRVGERTGLTSYGRNAMSGLEALLTRAPQDAERLAEGVAERRAVGIDPALIHVLDEQGAGTVRAASSRGAARTTAQEFANNARADIGDDIARQAAPLSPTSEPVAATTDRIEAGRKFLADDQYNAIRDTEVPVTDELKRILDTGAGRKAMRQAMETSDSPEEIASFLNSLRRSNEPSELDRMMSLLPEGMNPQARAQVEAQLRSQGVQGAPPLQPFTLDMLDRVKRNFQARQRDPDASGFTRQLQRMTSALVDMGDRAAPGYAEARANFAAQSGLVDAAETGTRVMRGNPDEFVAEARALGDDPVRVPRIREPEGRLTVSEPLDPRTVGSPAEATVNTLTYTLPDGRTIRAFLTRMPGSRQAQVDISGVQNWDQRANSFGTGVMQDVGQLIRQQFPDVDEVVGFRVTGSRVGTASNPADQGIARVPIAPRTRNGPSERDIARQAARRTLETEAGESPRAALALADRMAYGRNALHRLEALAGPETAERVTAGMRLTGEDYGRSRFIAPNTGSQTQLRQQDAADGLIDLGLNALSGGKVGAVRAVARYVRNMGIREIDADRLVALATDPTRTDEAIEYLVRRGAERREAARLTRSIVVNLESRGVGEAYDDTPTRRREPFVQ